VIISDKHKLIFITTPKSGSHTGFKLMEDYFEGEAKFNHSLKIPRKYKTYKSFTFVRNPYERFCALYHACVINDRKTFVPTKARNLLGYAKWMASIAKIQAFPRVDLCAAQHIWHKNSKLDEYVQIENAANTINLWYPELDIHFPHELKREHPVWKDIVTATLKYYVDIWAGKDFKLYGYKK